MTTELSIGVMGAGGRMGRALVRAITEAEGCRVAGGTEMAGHAELGKDLGTLAGIDGPPCEFRSSAKRGASGTIGTPDAVRACMMLGAGGQS